MGASLQGVLELNVLFLAAGLALLWGLRGFGSWLDLLETLGLALCLGLSAVAVLATLVLVAGGGLSTATILALCAAVAATGAAVALARHRPLPRTIGRLPRLSPGVLVAAGLALATVTILVAFVRVARVAPLGGGDSWEFWVPKAKIIYFFGSIDGKLFASLPGPRYPLLVPALQAMDFRFMGSTFAPALAFQYWFLYAGFVFAAAMLLRRLVPAWLAWLFVGLTAVIPELDNRLLGGQADWTLDVLYSLTALLAVCWLRTREPWLLAATGVVLAAVIATKQEGLLLAGCLGAGIGVATVRRWRTAWPPLIAVGVAAYLVNLPWRLWWGSRRLPAVLPTGGVHELVTHLSRAWPSLHLVLRLLFSYQMWLAFVPLALVAAAVSLTLGGEARETAVLYLATCALGVAGFTYILWNDLTYTLDERQSSTPIPRAVGSLVLLSTVLAPLVIEPLLRRRGRPGGAPPAQSP